MSHALSRLRERLGDELFVRSSEGMVPTPRARSLAPRIHAALAELQRALADTAFDPATASHSFTIAADPYARAVLIPRLVAAIRRTAPSVELRIRPGFTGLAEALDTGDIDLSIASYRRVPDRFGSRDLLEERHVWALSADQPAAQGDLTLERLADLPHLVRIIPGDEDAGADIPASGRGLERRAVQDDNGAFARALARAGRSRTTYLTMPDSFAALAAVAVSDLAALVPERMARQFATHFNLRLFEPPYESPPVRLTALWELGRGASPALRWLIDLLEQTATTA